ncbi:neurotrypsin-like [Mya arenaria]|uniref:neurotrypsin-like n=1 Tax=Mya arenaria TaxID=6604 RepID=UPI0022E933EF|nr:neurotrypsin-like [Mya arenaria]
MYNGINALVCQADGSWKTIGGCKPELCQKEDAIASNGSVLASTGPFLEGSSLPIQCNAGYIPANCNGLNALVCQADGSWKTIGGCKPESPLTCGDGPCTTTVESGGVLWRLCHGEAPGKCHPNKGRLEVNHKGEWRGVCDDQWLSTVYVAANKHVACRTLGFSHGVTAREFATDDMTIVDIGFWLDEVKCAGNESSLVECDYPGLGDEDCSTKNMETNPEYIGISCTNYCIDASLFPVF